MTEAEWLASGNAWRMLRGIREKVTTRRGELFGCACARHLWEHLPLECRHLVALMERHADDTTQPEVGGEDIEAAFHSARVEAPGHMRGAFDALILALCWYWAAEPHKETEQEAQNDSAMREELKAQAVIVRDIFGNPFRPVTADPSWLTSTVTALARGIYDERAFDRLPILADALQDAGCDHPDILAHCRGPGPHARGCWVVDLVLGKE